MGDRDIFAHTLQCHVTTLQVYAIIGVAPTFKKVIAVSVAQVCSAANLTFYKNRNKRLSSSILLSLF